MEQLNQLLLLSHEAGLSEGFFDFYWLQEPDEGKHPFNVKSLEDYDPRWAEQNNIISLEHLRWGFYRFYIDSLLYFGNIRQAYRILRKNTHHEELSAYFRAKTIDHDSLHGLVNRGQPLPLNDIPKDDRYLIAEMACKSYEPSDAVNTNMLEHLISEYKEYQKNGGGKIKVKDLLSGNLTKKNQERQTAFSFSASEYVDEEVSGIEEIQEKFEFYRDKFSRARIAALKNTANYLSMINDLDVYVATSMRNRDDFRKMADNCEIIFGDEEIKDFNLRYFDPTLSAAPGHEDKGLIECLMVKCAKVLIYMAGDKESYGKDAEAAMALSLGKPVIFFCDEEQKSRFYRDVHPLSRLINFETGVAVGAIVTSNILDVTRILKRILTNTMEYELSQTKENYLQLKEKMTGSVVRIQTSNKLLRETFWNHYHNPV